jgi:hypothetical protein
LGGADILPLAAAANTTKFLVAQAAQRVLYGTWGVPGIQTAQQLTFLHMMSCGKAQGCCDHPVRTSTAVRRGEVPQLYKAGPRLNVHSVLV